VGCAEHAHELREVIMTGIDFAVADIVRDDRDYDDWIDTITEASARLDVLQTTVTEVRYLCESGGVSSEEVLEVLERQGV
jgi:2-iminoacetate synthase ThiH